jgi:transcriptional regulator with XRE-family HTH domain
MVSVTANSERSPTPEEAFRSRLRELLERRGMSQRALARRIGSSESLVGLWIRGERAPTIRWLGPIAETLQVSADYLIGRSDDPLLVAPQSSLGDHGKALASLDDLLAAARRLETAIHDDSG